MQDIIDKNPILSHNSNKESISLGNKIYRVTNEYSNFNKRKISKYFEKYNILKFNNSKLSKIIFGGNKSKSSFFLKFDYINPIIF